MNNHIAANIKQLRLILGLTQAEFALPLGIHRSYVTKIERGEVEARSSLIQTICDTYRIKAGQLYRVGGIAQAVESIDSDTTTPPYDDGGTT